LALFGRRPPEHVVGIVIAGGRKPAQKQTSRSRWIMSAFDPKADMRKRALYRALPKSR
jgi:hypothetical protein